MSLAAMNYVWEHYKGPAARKLVLLRLADYCDEKWQCWPSAQSVAEDTNMGERTVRRHLLDLRAEGWLRCARRAGTSSRYTVLRGGGEGVQRRAVVVDGEGDEGGGSGQNDRGRSGQNDRGVRSQLCPGGPVIAVTGGSGHSCGRGTTNEPPMNHQVVVAADVDRRDGAPVAPPPRTPPPPPLDGIDQESFAIGLRQRGAEFVDQDRDEWQGLRLRFGARAVLDAVQDLPAAGRRNHVAVRGLCSERAAEARRQAELAAAAEQDREARQQARMAVADRQRERVAQQDRMRVIARVFLAQLDAQGAELTEKERDGAAALRARLEAGDALVPIWWAWPGGADRLRAVCGHSAPELVAMAHGGRA